ncbi:AAA family ATPase [Saccharopolyspora spinosporotrichia]
MYSAEHTERTYDELVRRSGELLGYGESVVLDASWTREHHRERAVEAANQARAIVVPLRCQAPESTTVERLRGRHATASDADEEVARSIASDADDWPSAWPIDTTGSPEDSADEAVAVIADPQRST